MLEEMNFTLDDFRRSNWQNFLSSAGKTTCEAYHSIFSQASKQARETGNIQLSHVYLLLHAVCSLWLRPEETTPFAPFFQGANGSRSVDISDFSEPHINLLKEIVSEVEDPDLRSRIADVIWTYQHHGNFQYAEMAIDAYLEASDRLWVTDEYYYGEQRFTRAIHLAASLGRKTGKFKEVVAKTEALIDQYAPEKRPFIGHLLELLYDFRLGNTDKYAAVAQSLAEFDKERREWHLARAHWNAAARWYRLSNNAEGARNCQLEEADCYVQEAEDTLKSNHGMRRGVAAHHLQRAIEAYRRISGTENRQKELHVLMLQLQESSREELSSISHEIDLKEPVEKALKATLGKPFIEALFSFCLLGSPPNVESLRETVQRNVAKTPFLSWVSYNVLDERGRVVGRRGSVFMGTPEEMEEAQIAEMHRWAKYEHDALAAILNVVRLNLIGEHNFDLREFLDLTTNHPFIPLGREYIFARGFRAGFHGDLLEALHLLIPQVENSLRYVLNDQGIVTSKLSSDGIQEEMDLNAILEMPELKNIFGEDIVFDLQGTLTSRFGYNFRNLMAHGLLDQQSYHSYFAIYIWWMLLRICCLPLIAAIRHEEIKDDTTPGEES